MESKARGLLKIIQSKSCRKHLEKIMAGETTCTRLDQYNKYGTFGMFLSGMGPFTLMTDLVRIHLHLRVIETMQTYRQKV